MPTPTLHLAQNILCGITLWNCWPSVFCFIAFSGYRGICITLQHSFMSTMLTKSKSCKSVASVLIRDFKVMHVKRETRSISCVIYVIYVFFKNLCCLSKDGAKTSCLAVLSFLLSDNNYRIPVNVGMFSYCTIVVISRSLCQGIARIRSLSLLMTKVRKSQTM